MNKKSGQAIVIYVILGIIVFTAAIAFPFVLDWMYGNGVLGKIWDNAFPAEVWFSFIGSYFPAAIIGILTLYQAYIIHYQEKQYKKLLDRHRFLPAGHASVYQYNEQDKKIGKYAFPMVEKMFRQSRQDYLADVWNAGYIIECDIYNFSGIGIHKAEVKAVEWIIDGNAYCQSNTKQMACVVHRISYSQQQIIVFWCFEGLILDDGQKIGDKIEQLMLYDNRLDDRFAASQITLTICIIDDESEKINLKMQFYLQTCGRQHELSSTEENYRVI